MSVNYEKAKRGMDSINNIFVTKGVPGNLNDHREMMLMLCRRFSGDSKIKIMSAEVDQGFFRWWVLFYHIVDYTLKESNVMNEKEISDYILDIWDNTYRAFFEKYKAENRNEHLRMIALYGQCEIHLVDDSIRAVAEYAMVKIFSDMYHLDGNESESLFYYCLNTYWLKSLNGEILRVMI